MRFALLVIAASIALPCAGLAQSPQVSADNIAFDIIQMQACRASWNFHVTESVNKGENIAADEIVEPSDGVPTLVGVVQGTKYAFSANTLDSEDVCGWFFIPEGVTDAARAVAKAQTQAIEASMPAFVEAGNEILSVIDPESDPKAASKAGQAGRTIGKQTVAALAFYRNQCSKFAVATSNAIVTQRPRLPVPGEPNPPVNIIGSLLGGDGHPTLKLRHLVGQDMDAFYYLVGGLVPDSGKPSVPSKD